MSYEIVKSISIKDNKVFMTSDSNNVSPRIFKNRHVTYFDTMLQEEGGIEKVELYILKMYEEGNFQSPPSVDNKFTRALRVLQAMPEYKAFNWHNASWTDKNCPITAARESEAFTDLLRKALNTKLEKQKIVITKDYCGTPVFLHKKTPNHVSWTRDKLQAKVFKYLSDAKDLAVCFIGGDQWKFETL